MTIHSITRLHAVNSLDKIQALNTLGVFTVRDMAEYAPCRHAELLVSFFQQNKTDEVGLKNYLEAEALSDDSIAHLDQLLARYLLSLNKTDAKHLKTVFDVETLSQLAEFPPYREAQQLVVESIRGAFYEKPSAPDPLIPKLIGSTHTQVRFSNYVREQEFVLDDYELTDLTDADEPSPEPEMLNIFKRARFRFYLGYLVSIHQKWTIMGTNLGEIIYSLPLAPGESRNIAVLEWYRRQRSSRREDTKAEERLKAEFTQTRALNEVVQTTANEHLYGETEVDSSTKTTGAGLVAGLGGVKSASGEGKLNLTALVGLPIEVAGKAVSSLAGSVGGSLVHSNASVQGTLKSETTGERAVGGELVQNISDSTVQNAANVRSLMSTVIVEDEQAGSQRAQTRNVTNYNHSHALNIQYYEVLHQYRVATGADSLCPVLFLPFGPLRFKIRMIQEYWHLLREPVKRMAPKRFFEFNQVVKDFDPNNESFDVSGDLTVEEIKITRTKNFTENIRVELDEANPKIVLSISGSDMDDCLTFKMTGNSTYVSYDILEETTHEQDDFGTASAFEVEESVKANLSSDFYSELKKVMKNYLDDKDKTPHAPVGTKRENLEDNELGPHSKRDNLIDDVDNDRFKILNKDEKIELTINIEYTVADKNGQEQIVNQTITKAYSFGTLEDEISEDVADVTAHINTYLNSVSDFNQVDVIEDIEQFFQFHKYGFTKYLLANAEKEQVIDIIENLGIASNSEILALTSIIDPNPIAMTENLLIFKLKEDKAARDRQVAEVFSGTATAPVFGKDSGVMTGMGNKKPVVRKGRKAWRYEFAGQPPYGKTTPESERANMVIYIFEKPNSAGKHEVEGTIELVRQVGKIQHKYPLALRGMANGHSGGDLKIDYEIEANPVDFPAGQNGVLDWTVKIPEKPGESFADLVNEYVKGLRKYEAELRKQKRVEAVFLPSSGVFAEAILGLSNASEYLNLRRFFNWMDSPIPNAAPEIQALNANQDYSKSVGDALNPTVPVSVLNQISPMQYPLPTSLNSALQAIQNGQMFNDMSKTGEFASILGNLANLANNTAQLSGNLAGDAGANALNAAVQLGQQVASMLGSTPNLFMALPPSNLTEQGTIQEELDKITTGDNSATSPCDTVKLPPLGVPVPPPAVPPYTPPSGGGGSGNPPTPPATSTFTKVEVQIESLNIVGGKRLSENLITLLNGVLAWFPVGGDIPEWVSPEFGEMIRPYSTLEVKGKLTLKNASGLIAEQKSFSIRSTDTLAIIKNEAGHSLTTFHSYTVNLLSPIKSLAELDGVETITAFANVDPVSAFDLLLNTGFAFGTAGITSILGIDEINILGWTFSVAEYSAMLTNAVLGSNAYSQNVEYFTNLRENWTLRDLALYVNNKSAGFDFIQPVHPLADICIAIPTSPPDLILG